MSETDTPLKKAQPLMTKDTTAARLWIQQARYQNDGLEGSVALLLAENARLRKGASPRARGNQAIDIAALLARVEAFMNLSAVNDNELLAQVPAAFELLADLRTALVALQGAQQEKDDRP